MIRAFAELPAHCGLDDREFSVGQTEARKIPPRAYCRAACSPIANLRSALMRRVEASNGAIRALVVGAGGNRAIRSRPLAGNPWA
jgi:hypothetical protein